MIGSIFPSLALAVKSIAYLRLERKVESMTDTFDVLRQLFESPAGFPGFDFAISFYFSHRNDDRAGVEVEFAQDLLSLRVIEKT